VAGAGTIHIDYQKKIMRIGPVEIREGEQVTIDGSKGDLMRGKVPTIQAQLSGDFA
jgi:pyruvate,orthophosphate dikinase